MENNSGKGLSIASMVIGIVALVGSTFTGGVAGLILAIIGLILGVVSKKQLTEAGQPSGMATAGIVMCIIALAQAAICLVACIACGGILSSMGY